MKLLGTKTLFAFFILSIISSKGQRTFSIDKIYLDSLDRHGYKVFIVSEGFNIDFIGKRFTPDKRFSLDSSQISLTEKAIREQYIDACLRQLDSQWRKAQVKKEDSDKELSSRQVKKFNRKLKARLRKEKQSLDGYDQYLFGYINEKGQKIILIRFDPHVIKYYSLGGEGHISNLSIMVYNTQTGKLNLSGWDR